MVASDGPGVVGSLDGWPGVVVGDDDGFRVGFRVIGRGVAVSVSDGICVGCGDGCCVGIRVGLIVGRSVGASDGICVVGSLDGWLRVVVGDDDGLRVGFRVVGRGVSVSVSDGICVGCDDVFCVGVWVGLIVG